MWRHDRIKENIAKLNVENGTWKSIWNGQVKRNNKEKKVNRELKKWNE